MAAGQGSSMTPVRLLLLAQLLLCVPILATAAKMNYNTLYVDAGLRAKAKAELVAEATAASSSKAEGGSLWAAEIVLRDRVSGVATVNPSSTSVEDSKADVAFLQRLARDAARVKAIEARLKIARMGANTAEWKPADEQEQEGLSQEELTSPIQSGLSQGSGEYFTRLGIGTPPTQTYLVVDTGSDLSWIQCEPCNSCYKQTGPLFDPSSSSSYAAVSCSNSLCSQLLLRSCSSNQCEYQVSYGDGSFTVGDFAVETLTFSGSQATRLALGCGHDNEGLFIGAAGLLGMGGGSLSVPTQLKQQFSYCLPDRFGTGSSSLIFGNGAVPAGAVSTSLLSNSKLRTFYYVRLQGISVGGTRLPIAASNFALQSSGNGGVILDSGTSITRLVTSAYTTLRDSFAAGASSLPTAGSFSLFDTCYALGGMTSVDVPTVDLHFGGGATMSLPADNYLIPVDTAGTYCFGFAATSAGFSIIGNMQQQGFRIAFNAAAAQVSFASNQC